MRALPASLVALLLLISSLAVAGTSAAAPRPRLQGTCLEVRQLPCTATPGQAYGATTIDRSGNDGEAAVEAVVSHVLGDAAAIAPLASRLTRDGGAIDLTPDVVDGVLRFDWRYDGPSAGLAYITVKAATAMAVIGVAGATSGTVDVGELLGGHDISHVSFWEVERSLGRPVRATEVHGEDLLGNARLARIDDDGVVACMHTETAEVTECRFDFEGGSWIDSAEGPFALAGQSISPDGGDVEEHIVAATISTDGTVPSLEPVGYDAAGVAVGRELFRHGVVEQLLSPANRSGQPLRNVATLEVCTSSHPHPDGAALTRTLGAGVHCYSGPGAALNDLNGTERDGRGVYFAESWAQHYIWSNGVEVPAAKRPATINFPSPARVNTSSPVVWRPVARNVVIANK